MKKELKNLKEKLDLCMPENIDKYQFYKCCFNCH